jgi:SecD/SecF fusion protein
VSGYFDRIEQQLVHRVEAGVPRRSRIHLRLNLVAPAVSVAVALVVVAVFLSARSGTRSPAPGSGGTVELVYLAEPTAQVPHVTQAALARTAEVMRERAAAAGDPGASIRVVGSEIAVRLAANETLARTEAEIATTAQLYFYDWEANALLPDGATVASKLLAQDQSALTISQGSGAPGAGSMTLYDAVKLAVRQPASRGESRAGSQYYLFASGGSAACAASARSYGVGPADAGEHCLLAGPANSTSTLQQDLPPSVTMSEGELLVVKPGTVVLQAVPASFANPPKPAAPSTQFYALRDHVALDGAEITHPRRSTDAGGNPDVDFGFTGQGAKAFTSLTRAIAHRGSEVSGAGSQLQQHFAVALDDVLITVPQIDYAAYPDGIPSDHGAQIAAGLTLSSARTFADELKIGALPVGLKLISDKRLPGRS